MGPHRRPQGRPQGSRLAGRGLEERAVTGRGAPGALEVILLSLGGPRTQGPYGDTGTGWPPERPCWPRPLLPPAVCQGVPDSEFWPLPGFPGGRVREGVWGEGLWEEGRAEGTPSHRVRLSWGCGRKGGGHHREPQTPTAPGELWGEAGQDPLAGRCPSARDRATGALGFIWVAQDCPGRLSPNIPWKAESPLKG